MDTQVQVGKVVGQIILLEEQLSEIECDVTQLSVMALRKLLKEALPGIRFERIITGEYYRVGDNRPNFNYSDVRGAYLFSLEDRGYHEDPQRNVEIIDVDELFLHRDGTFHLYTRSGRWSTWEKDPSCWSREDNGEMQLEELDYDQVYNCIIVLLKKRLDALKSRIKTQAERLERVKSFDLRDDKKPEVR